MLKPAILAAVRSDARRMRIGRDDGRPKGMAILLRGGQLTRLAGTSQCEAGNHARNMALRKLGIAKTLPRDLENGGKTRLYSEPQICRTALGRRKYRPAIRGQPGTRLRAAAIDTQKERLLVDH